MNCLLDTGTFPRFIVDNPRLPARVRDMIRDPEADFDLSVVSVWAIPVKYKLGKLPLPEARQPATFIRAEWERHHVETLPLDGDAIVQLMNLPDYPRDPFDRMLVCQAISTGLAIVTSDEAIRQYPVRTFWS